MPCFKSMQLLLMLIFLFPLWGCGDRVVDNEQVEPGEKIVLKFSHVVAEDTPKGLAAMKFAKLAAQKTGGRVEVQVFPNSTLYADGEELTALRNGSVHIIAPSTSKLGDLFPRWQIFDIPYAFTDCNDIHRAMRGKIGQELYGDLERGGIYPLAFWDNGFKQITNRVKPIIHPSDFKDLTFRVMMNSSVLKEQFRCVGAIPIQLRFNEVYDALSSHAVDGQENTMSNIASQKFYDNQPYLTISNHGFMGYAVLVDKKFWQDLPEDIRKGLEEAMREVTAWEQTQAGLINERDMHMIRESGKVNIHMQTPGEKKEWQRAMAGIYATLPDTVGTQLVSELKSWPE